MKSFYKNQNLNLIASTAQQIVFNNSKNGKLESTNTQDAIDEISNILDEEKTMISDAWNSATAYTVGQYCIYNNTLWKCLVQHNGQEPSEGTYWTKTQIDDEMLAIKNDVSTLNSNLDESKILQMDINTIGFTIPSRSIALVLYDQNLIPNGAKIISCNILKLEGSYDDGYISIIPANNRYFTALNSSDNERTYTSAKLRVYYLQTK